jgi:2-polyprenyl-6-methoxyphenol hydroxylase-like FAD-dependent oxidoreductase
MGRNPLRVVVVGAGTGGLCLAQGLKSDGVAVEVFERDHSPSDRLQGYRLGINAGGSRALRACLPDALFAKLIASSAPSQCVSFLDHRLNRLLAIDFPRTNRATVDNDRPVSRSALRRILLEGLEDVVHFGKKFVAFEDQPGGAVSARFDDGSMATGDVLVGADGAGSHLRTQLLPHAKRIETGIIIASGKFGLSDDVRAQTPQAIWRGPTLILGPKGRFLFGNAVEYGYLRDKPATDVDKTESEPNGRGSASDHHDEYVMWGHDEYVMWGFRRVVKCLRRGMILNRSEAKN